MYTCVLVCVCDSVCVCVCVCVCVAMCMMCVCIGCVCVCVCVHIVIIMLFVTAVLLLVALHISLQVQGHTFSSRGRMPRHPLLKKRNYHLIIQVRHCPLKSLVQPLQVKSTSHNSHRLKMNTKCSFHDAWLEVSNIMLNCWRVKVSTLF